ncbi:ATP-binding cassette domain-containing protein [Streptomyces sp. NPDC101132]|uniref:ATP-binding cassette domain-containing protein n=1 Tax=Streptomyces sp. NPDC101132 TaxID=3366110 RepID=UPI00382C4E08
MTVDIALSGVKVRYGPLEALHGVDLALPAATLTLLVGRNGSGRTSVLRALAGAVPVAAGTVRWRGEDVTRMRAHDRARRGLCFVPEERALYGTLTVAENLALAGPAGDPSAALEAYPALAALLPRTAATLSGGEQRQLAVARALLAAAARPDPVVLVDEPVQGMSPEVAARTYELLAGLARAGATVVAAGPRVPRALARPGVLVHELVRGRVAFSAEAVEPVASLLPRPPEGPGSSRSAARSEWPR